MSKSPNDIGDGTIKVSLYSEGNVLDDDYALVLAIVYRKINKIPYAKLVFKDGNMEKGDFPLSNKDDLKPGKLIKIEAGYGQETESIFEGIVVKHGIKISGKNSSILEVELKDKAVSMTLSKKSASYIDMKDSDIMSELIGNYNLTADVEVTDTQFKQMVQYYSTDWDFVLNRAEANGLLIIVDDGNVSVKTPQLSEDSVLKVSYGLDLMYFKADVDASQQFSTTSSSAWNCTDQKLNNEEGEDASLNEQGDIKQSELAEAMGSQEFILQNVISYEESELKPCADFALMKSGLGKIKGKIHFQGNAKVKPGAIIELDKVGNRFNGNVYVSAVKHVLADGNWISEVDMGLSTDGISQNKTTNNLNHNKLLPDIEGLHIGTVEKLDADPLGEIRIQVKCPLLGDSSEAIWARLSNMYAFSEYGSFFIPEIGSEVILGFFNNDPRFPVVLGSMYSSNNKSPYELTADNFTKAIVTKNKLKIEFDDDKKSTSILTPAGNSIVLSDDEKSIVITDQNENKIELSSDGIVLDSPKDISITSKAKIKLDGTGGIELQSTSDIKLSGMNIDQEANAGFTAKGTASAELSASGSTTVKGSMVMIN